MASSQFTPGEKMSPTVLIYSSATCPYCERAKMLFKKKNISYTEIRIDLDPEKRIEMQNKAHRQTVPQIFINDHHNTLSLQHLFSRSPQVQLLYMI